MADRTSKSGRGELGLTYHPVELSCSFERTDTPEDRKEKRKMKKQRKMMKNQSKDNDNDVAEAEAAAAEEEDRNRAEIKEKRKMQRKRNRKMMANYYNGVAEAEEDDMLVSQILSRLPAKSLMRCKCVCKAWKSIIEHDSHFINLHHTRSQAHPRFLIAAFPRPRRNQSPDCESSFFSADLHYDYDGIEASIHSITRGWKSIYRAVNRLIPVRGLVCLIDDLFAVQIRNVSTGQATPWINSVSYRVMFGKHKAFPGCQFGYDPNTGKHKVVYVWTGERCKEDRFCEVLTVGDTRWRRVIDDVPHCHIMGCHRSAYVNGSVYWLTLSAVDDSQSLLAFDIGSEKFRMIPIPSFALCPRPSMGVIEMDGCMTVIRVECLRPLSPELKLWKFRDDHDKEEWTEEDSIIIPSYISKNMRDIFFHPIPGKDQMILEIRFEGLGFAEQVGSSAVSSLAWFCVSLTLYCISTAYMIIITNLECLKSVHSM
ncbi:F-box protein DOR [Linum perenne]